MVKVQKKLGELISLLFFLYLSAMVNLTPMKCLFLFLGTAFFILQACKTEIYTKDLQRVVHTDSLIWHVKVTEDQVDVKNEEHYPVYYITGKTLGVTSSDIRNVKVLDGTIEMYSFDHKIVAQGVFKDGLKDDEWYYYNEDGSLRKKESFRNGELQSVMENTTESPVVGDYKNGQKHGEWIENGDTLEYKHGEIVVEKVKPEKDKAAKSDTTKQKEGFFKRLFKKKDKKEKKQKDKDKKKKDKKDEQQTAKKDQK